MTLSAIQAILRGRKEVPEYISGKMVKLDTLKGCDVRYDEGRWYRRLTSDEISEREKQYGGWDYDDDLLDGEWVELPSTFDPRVGGACMLGVQAIAMGHELFEFVGSNDGEGEPYFVHPDFMLDEEDRKRYPNGVMWNGARSTVRVAQGEYPCVCATSMNEWGGPLIAGMTKSVPEIIAHLNDRHDPRRDEGTDPLFPHSRAVKIEMTDLWPESRIIDWLRGLGYNGDH